MGNRFQDARPASGNAWANRSDGANRSQSCSLCGIARLFCHCAWYCYYCRPDCVFCYRESLQIESEVGNSWLEIIENIAAWCKRYADWLTHRRAFTDNDDLGNSYPFVKNKHAPFTPARRALPMLNLALISSAGAYIDGTEPFDTGGPGGDLDFREIPTLVDPIDLRFSARGYNPAAVRLDINSEVPLERLFEFESNGIIGRLNEVFWRFCGFIPDAGTFAERTVVRLVERVKRYEVQAALLIPASRLCH